MVELHSGGNVPLTTGFRLRILLVEDDQDARDLMECVLRTTGEHSILVVANAEDGIEHLRTENFDVIFTDIGLPGASGIEMLDQARREDILARADIVVCTANGWEKPRVFERGARFVLKPVSVHTVVEAVRTAGMHRTRAWPLR
jgi:CheY-like chemotaxis protein